MINLSNINLQELMNETNKYNLVNIRKLQQKLLDKYLMIDISKLIWLILFKFINMNKNTMCKSMFIYSFVQLLPANNFMSPIFDYNRKNQVSHILIRYNYTTKYHGPKGLLVDDIFFSYISFGSCYYVSYKYLVCFTLSIAN